MAQYEKFINNKPGLIMPSKDRVTITLYSRQNDDGTTYNQAMFNEWANIQKIRDEFVIASKKAGKSPPEIVVSVTLIPNWAQGHTYQDKRYKQIKEQFIVQCNNQFAGSHVQVQDFYEEGGLTQNQKAFLDQNQSLGSNIDMMKMRAVINNKGNRHLQVDSNTQIISLRALYEDTFGCSDSQQQDGLNGILYAGNFISAHNKIIYCTERSQIPVEMEHQLEDACKRNDSSLTFKTSTSNYLYATVFTRDLGQRLGWVKLFTSQNKAHGSQPTNYYAADLTQPIYKLTKHVVAAVKKSWAQSTAKPPYLKELESIQLVVDNITLDFAVFDTLIKKYTRTLHQHDTAFSLSPGTTAKKMRSISNEAVEHRLILEFYKYATQLKHEALNAYLAQVPQASLFLTTLETQASSTASSSNGDSASYKLNDQKACYPFRYEPSKSNQPSLCGQYYHPSANLTYQVHPVSNSISPARTIKIDIQNKCLLADEQLFQNPSDLLYAEALIVRTLDLLKMRYEGIAKDLDEKESGATRIKAKAVQTQLDAIQQGVTTPREAITNLLANKNFTKKVWRPFFNYKSKNLLHGGGTTGKTTLEEVGRIYDKALQTNTATPSAVGMFATSISEKSSVTPPQLGMKSQG